MKLIIGLLSLISLTSEARNFGPNSPTALTTVRNVYSSTNVTTSAFVTLISSTSATLTQLNIFDSSGQTLVLSYAATCGSLSSLSNSVLITPGGNGTVDWAIPTGVCLGIKAVSGTANSGELDITFFQ